MDLVPIPLKLPPGVGWNILAEEHVQKDELLFRLLKKCRGKGQLCDISWVLKHKSRSLLILCPSWLSASKHFLKEPVY